MNKENQYCYDYPRPMVTVDIVLLGGRIGSLTNDYVLLIERKKAPFKGCLALPGGFIEVNEDIQEAALRELKEETGIILSTLRQFGVIGTPYRDPRGHVISVVFYLWKTDFSEYGTIQASSDALNAEWVSIETLGQCSIAFDYIKIIHKVWHKAQALGTVFEMS